MLFVKTIQFRQKLHPFGVLETNEMPVGYAGDHKPNYPVEIYSMELSSHFHAQSGPFIIANQAYNFREADMWQNNGFG